MEGLSKRGESNQKEVIESVEDPPAAPHQRGESDRKEATVDIKLFRLQNNRNVIYLY